MRADINSSGAQEPPPPHELWKRAPWRYLPKVARGGPSRRGWVGARADAGGCRAALQREVTQVLGGPMGVFCKRRYEKSFRVWSRRSLLGHARRTERGSGCMVSGELEACAFLKSCWLWTGQDGRVAARKMFSETE